MLVWQMTGLCFDSVRQATVQHWMMVGVYFTRTFLLKMKKVKSALCFGCKLQNEDLSHLLLHCSYFTQIREKYLPQYILQNSRISEILNDEELIIQTILDPVSSNLPEIIRNNWVSVKTAYTLSRQFCYNLHQKREKLYSEIEMEKRVEK